MSPGSQASVDPSSVPVLPAATVIIVDDRPDLHVLVLRRRAGSAFVGGMSVFPGGGVDAEDADPAWGDHVFGLDDRAASAALGVDSGGIAYWIAVLRETYEEAGVLLGADPLVDGSGELRRAVDAGETPFLEAVLKLGVGFDLGAIHVVARWITPVGPPRRYDTYLFLARLPAGCEASHDGVEAVAHEWMRPGDALARRAAGELVMMAPTVAMLQQLSAYDRAEAAVGAAARAHGPGLQAHTRRDGSGNDLVTLPGDPGHERGQPAAGWMRLGVDQTGAMP